MIIIRILMIYASGKHLTGSMYTANVVYEFQNSIGTFGNHVHRRKCCSNYEF